MSMFELNTPETPQIYVQSSLSNTYLSVSQENIKMKKNFFFEQKNNQCRGKCEKFELNWRLPRLVFSNKYNCFVVN